MINFKTINEADFDSTVKGNALVLFGAATCGMCKMMRGVLSSITEDIGDFQFYETDVMQNRKLANKFNISSIPVTIVFKNGAEIARFNGVKSKKAVLEAMLKEA